MDFQKGSLVGSGSPKIDPSLNGIQGAERAEPKPPSSELYAPPSSVQDRANQVGGRILTSDKNDDDELARLLAENAEIDDRCVKVDQAKPVVQAVVRAGMEVLQNGNGKIDKQTAVDLRAVKLIEQGGEKIQDASVIVETRSVLLETKTVRADMKTLREDLKSVKQMHLCFNPKTGNIEEIPKGAQFLSHAVKDAFFIANDKLYITQQMINKLGDKISKDGTLITVDGLQIPIREVHIVHKEDQKEFETIVTTHYEKRGMKFRHESEEEKEGVKDKVGHNHRDIDSHQPQINGKGERDLQRFQNEFLLMFATSKSLGKIHEAFAEKRKEFVKEMEELEQKYQEKMDVRNAEIEKLKDQFAQTKADYEEAVVKIQQAMGLKPGSQASVDSNNRQ